MADAREIVCRKNSTTCCGGQKYGVEESSTAINASVIEAGLWRHQYASIAWEESLLREAMNRWSNHSRHGDWDISIFGHISNLTKIYLSYYGFIRAFRDI